MDKDGKEQQMDQDRQGAREGGRRMGTEQLKQKEKQEKQEGEIAALKAQLKSLETRMSESEEVMKVYEKE